MGVEELGEGDWAQGVVGGGAQGWEGAGGARRQ